MNLPALRALTRHPNLPIALLIIFNILAGLATFRAYGMSWDEPLFYRYAEAIPGAYSISARLAGTFNLEDAYGPSSDHGRYGPAYLLMARWPALALQSITGVDEPAAWHLVNFLTFQFGVFVFYLLLRRWVSPPAALGATALFAWQPVLWGHAFMNPKDMPFMVFFIISVYTGLRMLDSAKKPADLPDVSPKTWARAEKIIATLWILVGLTALGFILFPQPIAQLAHDTLTSAYNNLSGLPGQVFSLLTVNARNAPLEVYQVKLDRLLAQARIALPVSALAPGLLLAALRLARPQLERARRWLHLDLPAPVLLAAGLMVGLATSVRILGPLAGVIVALAFLLRWRQRALIPLALYGLTAFAVCYSTWPYLWGAPVEQFLAVLARNAENPERVRMLFAGQITYSDEIPLSYMPTMLGWTLTEPVWVLAAAGAIASVLAMRKSKLDWRTWLPATLWLVIPLAYIFISRPPLYDGFRHFTFIIPAIFMLGAPALQVALGWLKRPALQIALIAALALPGFIGYAQLHPYEYAYYNGFAGGTRTAFRQYETEYWLTCYKEAFDYLNAQSGRPVFVLRNLLLARAYARPGLDVNFIPDDSPMPGGSLVLLTTRTNSDQFTLPDAPVVHDIRRAGAVFCVIKQIP